MHGHSKVYLHRAVQQHPLIGDIVEQYGELFARLGRHFVGEFVFVVAVVGQLAVSAGQLVACLAEQGQFLLE